MNLLNIDGAVNTPVPVSWAVGPEDEAGWLHISAVTEEAAIAQYANGDLDVIEGGALVAIRVEAWDHVTGQPTARQWIEAGLGYCCISCEEIATTESGVKFVDDTTVYCESCWKEQKLDKKGLES